MQEFLEACGVSNAMGTNDSVCFENDEEMDTMSRQLRQEAITAAEEEPELRTLLSRTVLAPGVRTFEDAVAATVTYRLLLRPTHAATSSISSNGAEDFAGEEPMFCPNSLRGIIAEALHSTEITEAGHSMSEAVRLDALAVCERDPAVDTLLEVVLFLKGFAALVCHRAAYYKWHTTTQKMNQTSNRKRRSMTALWLQSQASAVFGLDIHPAATLGAGILLDHGTGVVIGETATVGDGCTLLHGVTLGGTGKDTGDRHPKVGRDVLIGANASLLGNIAIGDGAKIGAGSIVLRPIPAHATAVGAPAKIIGRAREDKPASTMDETLWQVNPLHKSTSVSTLDTVASSSVGSSNSTASSPPVFATLVEDSSETVEATVKKDTVVTRTIETSPMTLDDSMKDSKTEKKQTQANGGKEALSSEEMDAMCPFREYVRMAEMAPPGSITFCSLTKMLKARGCCSPQVGDVFFQLDERNVGYIKAEDFFSERTQSVLVEKTALSAAQVATLMADFLRQWRQQQQDRGHALTANQKPFSMQSGQRDISVTG